MFDIAPYQFLEWNAETFCCGDYVLLVLRDYKGLKAPPVNYQGSTPLHAAIALKHSPLRKLFKPIEKPKPFCVVELQQFKSADHVGVCVEIDGELMVTHCEQLTGVVISTFNEIKETYKILGFYECNC